MSRQIVQRTLLKLQRFQRVAKRNSSDHYVTDFKAPTMNDLPLPKGSWQEGYNKKQTKYNIQLAGSIAFLAATTGFAIAGGFIELNMAPERKNK